MENQFTTVKLSNMTWHFTPEVIDAFHDIGIPVPSGLNSFILKVLSMRIVQEGEIEFTSMGLGLKIRKRKFNISVELLEEVPSRVEKAP